MRCSVVYVICMHTVCHIRQYRPTYVVTASAWYILRSTGNISIIVHANTATSLQPLCILHTIPCDMLTFTKSWRIANLICRTKPKKSCRTLKLKEKKCQKTVRVSVKGTGSSWMLSVVVQTQYYLDVNKAKTLDPKPTAERTNWRSFALLAVERSISSLDFHQSIETIWLEIIKQFVQPTIYLYRPTVSMCSLDVSHVTCTWNQTGARPKSFSPARPGPFGWLYISWISALPCAIIKSYRPGHYGTNCCHRPIRNRSDGHGSIQVQIRLLDKPEYLNSVCSLGFIQPALAQICMRQATKRYWVQVCCRRNQSIRL